LCHGAGHGVFNGDIGQIAKIDPVERDEKGERPPPTGAVERGSGRSGNSCSISFEALLLASFRFPGPALSHKFHQQLFSYE
jgi:hypothetical protein